MDNFNNFRIDPAKFKAIMFDRKMSQKDLAKAIGCKDSEISRYVTGKGYASAPKPERLKAICKALNCKVQDIIALPDETPPVKADDAQVAALGIRYNTYGVERITLAGRLYWQTDNPNIAGQLHESVYWEIPDLLAEYLANALSLGLKRLQGPKMIDRL